MTGVLGCIDIMLVQARRTVDSVRIRPPADGSRDPQHSSETSPLNHRQIRRRISDNGHRYDSHSPPIPIPYEYLPTQFRFIVSPGGKLDDDSLAMVLLDRVFWQWSAIRAVCEPDINPKMKILPPGLLRIHVALQTYPHALASARVIRALYASYHIFGALNFQVVTSTITSVEKAKEFIAIIQRSYLKAILRLRNVSSMTCGSLFLNLNYEERHAPAELPGSAKLAIIDTKTVTPEGINLFYAYREYGTGERREPEQEFMQYNPDDDSDWEGEAELKARAELQRISRVVNQSGYV